MADTNTQPRKVLFIEDELFIGELYMRALTKANYQVKVIKDGVEGYKEAATDAYDIILLDLMLPNMLGLDILKSLREQKPNLKAKIIITTNLEQSKGHREAIENQADAYLIKAEVTPRQLVEFLGNIK
ncbi:MAG: response regulator transcription factor [Minisyncoccia bacterium]